MSALLLPIQESDSSIAHRCQGFDWKISAGERRQRTFLIFYNRELKLRHWRTGNSLNCGAIGRQEYSSLPKQPETRISDQMDRLRLSALSAKKQ
jgi:hypothetical protein